MYTHHHIPTLEFKPNIPLLDREFDKKSPEIDEFILSHAQDCNEDFSFIPLPPTGTRFSSR